MGVDISDGGGHSLHTRKACWLVIDWCERVLPSPEMTPAEAQDNQGSIDYTAEQVSAANAVVPLAYADARALGWFKDADGDELDFGMARQFLVNAAQTGQGFSGSY